MEAGIFFGDGGEVVVGGEEVDFVEDVDNGFVDGVEVA